MKTRVSLIVLYDADRRFLLQQRSKDAPLLPGHWAFFGGAIEDGETKEDALARETYEELDYTLTSPRLALEQNFTEGDTQGYMYVYIERFSGDKSTLKLQEGQGMGWFSEAETKDLRMIERDKNVIKRINGMLLKEAERLIER